MAREIIERLVDDLAGGPAVETVAFGLDGATYEIDLNKKNATALRKALEHYIAAARSTKPAPATKRTTTKRAGQGERWRIRARLRCRFASRVGGSQRHSGSVARSDPEGDRRRISRRWRPMTPGPSLGAGRVQLSRRADQAVHSTLLPRSNMPLLSATRSSGSPLRTSNVNSPAATWRAGAQSTNHATTTSYCDRPTWPLPPTDQHTTAHPISGGLERDAQ